MNNLVPKILWPEFQKDNSWIIKSESEKACSCYVFCDKCGFHYIKELGYFQKKQFNQNSLYCLNCNNKEFILNLENYKQLINYKTSIKKGKKSFLILAYMNQPKLKGKDIVNERKILFKFKHYLNTNFKYKRPIYYDNSVYIETYFYHHLIKMDVFRTFIELLYEYIKKNAKTSYPLPDKLNEYKMLETIPMLIFNIINNKRQYSDFRFNLLTLDKDFLSFDDYISYISNYTKSKAIRRELYKNSTYEFNPEYFHLAYVFCYCLKDVNIILFFLKKIKGIDKFNSLLMIEDNILINVIQILIKRYPEKKLKNLIFEIGFEDIIWMIYEIGFDYKYNFDGIRCNVDSIHRRLLYIHRIQGLGEEEFIKKRKH